MSRGPSRGKRWARSSRNSPTRRSRARVAAFARPAGDAKKANARVRREKRKPKGRVPGTAAVAHLSRDTGSSRTTQETGLVASRRKKCACSSVAAARDAGSQGCSTAARALASSSSSSGQGKVAASTSVSAGSCRSAWRFRFRRARGNCVRSTDAHLSSLSTCRIISWPACSRLRSASRGKSGGGSARFSASIEARERVDVGRGRDVFQISSGRVKRDAGKRGSYPRSSPPRPVNSDATFMARVFDEVEPPLAPF